MPSTKPRTTPVLYCIFQSFGTDFSHYLCHSHYNSFLGLIFLVYVLQTFSQSFKITILLIYIIIDEITEITPITKSDNDVKCGASDPYPLSAV